MKSQILDEFIKYAMEQYGYDISVKESLTPDSFASIFGVSFLGQSTDFYMPDGESIEYVNHETKMKMNFGDVVYETDSIWEIELAA